MALSADAIESLLQSGLPPLLESVAAPMLLTIARFSGLVSTAPLLCSPVITWRLRMALAVTLGGCFGIVAGTWAAVPVGWHIDLVWLAPAELALGASIGLGARLLLAGLELTAGIIEQQAGWSPATTHHPMQSGETTATAGLLAVLAGLSWLLLTPLGGDLRIVSAVLDSLRVLPVGAIDSLESPVQLVRTTLSATCLIGFQAAAPMVVSIGLLQGLWGVLARARGGAVWQPALSPIRMLLALLVLTATVTDLGDALSNGCLQLFDALDAHSVAAVDARWEASP